MPRQKDLGLLGAFEDVSGVEQAGSVRESLVTPHCASPKLFAYVFRLVAIAATAYLLTLPALADTITVYDGTDKLRVVHLGTSHSFTSACGNTAQGVEVCGFAVASLTATIQSTIGGGQPIVVIGEPGGAFVSDIFTFEGVTKGLSGFMGAFISDSDTGPQQACGPSNFMPCTIIENGGIQTALTVAWTDGTVDTIRFQSDVPVPEPSSLLLSLVGLALVGLWIHCARG